MNFSSANSASVITPGNDTLMIYLKVANSSTNAAASGVTVSTRNVLYNSDVDLTGASGGTQGVLVGSASATLDSCRVKVVSTCPAVITLSSAVVFGNTIYGSGGIGISMNTNSGCPFIRNNTIVGCAGDGIDIVTGTTTPQHIFGNLITDNTGVGIDATTTAVAVWSINNRFRDNSAATNSGTDWLSVDNARITTDTGGPETDYTASGSSDYSLIHLSPATNANEPKYSSIGALQRASAGAATSGGFFIQ